MTFTKIDSDTWRSSKENKTFYIDKGTIGIYSMYFLTILEDDDVVLGGMDFFKLNEAKQYAKQY